VFGRARENARRSSCQSNLKQMSLALIQYTQDYDEKFPQGDNKNFWPSVNPYLKSDQILKCPSDTAAAGIPFGVNDIPPGTTKYQSYAWNDKLRISASANGQGGIGSSLAAVVTPSQSVMFCEYYWEETPCGHYGGPSIKWARDNKGDPSNRAAVNQWAAYVRHLEGSNYSFCDGHVKWLRPEKLSESDDVNSTDGKGFWFPPGRSQ
jgi:prepilin-type processing-associated H-X9-DG protein